jgi:hypothetical protein
LEERHPFSEFLDLLSSYLRGQLDNLLEMADKYGISIPVAEETIPEIIPTTDDPMGDVHEDLSALLLKATSELVPESKAEPTEAAEPVTAPEVELSLTDTLGLGKLIQDSLTDHDASISEDQDAAAANSVKPSESNGLASLIASKLSNGFDNITSGISGLPSTTAYQQVTTSGKCHTIEQYMHDPLLITTRSSSSISISSSAKPAVSDSIFLIYSTAGPISTSGGWFFTSTEPIISHFCTIRTSKASSRG